VGLRAGLYVSYSCLRRESNCNLSYKLSLDNNHTCAIMLTCEMMVVAHFTLTISYCWILLNSFRNCALCRIIALFEHSLLIGSLFERWEFENGAKHSNTRDTELNSHIFHVMQTNYCTCQKLEA
jgi:hypothetical protein